LQESTQASTGNQTQAESNTISKANRSFDEEGRADEAVKIPEKKTVEL